MLDAESFALIGLDAFFNHPTFSQFDGTDYAVAILDSGAAQYHEVFGPDEIAPFGVGDRIVYQYDFLDDDDNAFDEHVGFGHGTAVAGLIAQMLPGANLIILRVLPSDLSFPGYEVLNNALEWVWDNKENYNIVAVNMSFGDGNYDEPVTDGPLSDVLDRLAGENVGLIAASGNSFADYNLDGTQNPMPGIVYPAADAAAISVGATWKDEYEGGQTFSTFFPAEDYTQVPDQIAAFSQREATMLDVFAPGASITVPYSAGFGTSYGPMQGTSIAAAHVTAAVVLAQQLNDEFQFYNGRLSRSQLVDLLQTTGVEVYDGDDEDDNVINTEESYKRLNIEGMAYKLFKPIGTPGLVLTSDWGFSETDNITGDTTPTFSGTALPGAHVFLYVNGVVVGDAQADISGNYTVTVASNNALSAGAKEVTIRIAANASVPPEAHSQSSGELTVTIVDTEQQTPVVSDFKLRLSETLVIEGDGAANTSLQADWTTTPVSVTKAGSGTVIIDTVSDRSVPVVFYADGGTTQFVTDTGVAGIPNVSTREANWLIEVAATVEFTTNQNLEALAIGSSGTVIMTAATQQNYKLLYVNEFAIAESGGQPTGKLDLTNNGMVIDFSTVTAAQNYADNTLRDWLIAGRGGTGLGSGDWWNGSTGIMSSTAYTRNLSSPNSRSIGYAVNGALPLGAKSTFLGQTVDTSTILIRHTITGDVNLDGKVDDDDITVLGANYGPTNPKPHWARGDVDYNGYVDDDDVTLFGAFYNPSYELDD